MKAFSAGVDLRQLEENGTDISSGGVGKDLDKYANAVIKLLEDSPKAVISMINGFCYTGGLELALSADPKLIERPIVIKDTHAILGRPPENVLKLL